MGPKTSVPQSPAPRWRASAQAAARLLQFGVIALTLGLFVASLPLTYRQLRAVCAAPPCPPDQLNWKGVETLAGFGLPPEFPAGVFTALSVLFAGVYTASALLLIARKPQEPLTIFVSVMLVTFGAATFTGATRGLAEAPAVWRLAAEVVQFFGNLAIMAFFFVFPTGRFAPRWTASATCSSSVRMASSRRASGPMYVSSRVGSPITKPFTLATKASTKASQIVSWT